MSLRGSEGLVLGCMFEVYGFDERFICELTSMSVRRMFNPKRRLV